MGIKLLLGLVMWFVLAVVNSMAIISGGNIIEGVGGRPIIGSGAPSAGTSEVQTLTIGGTPEGGTFKIAFDGFTTGAITWSATDATLLAAIDAALEALPNIGTGGVVTAAGTLTDGIGTITLTFGGNLAKQAVALATIANNSLTGTAPTLGIVETTPGVNATARGMGIGTMYINSANGTVYVNTGTALAPTWTVVGAQS
jgi:hypothetical protein